MTARDEILASVRRALGPDRPGQQPVPRGYRDEPDVDREAVVDRFAERVADYQAVVTRVPAHDVAEAVREALPEGARVVVPDGMSFPVPDALVDTGLTAVELNRVDAVVTVAAVGVAETGTIVLDHGPGQGRRALTLVPDLHVCVVRADQVVPDVPQAVTRLDPGRPQTWISGPSATSDIELSRVEGVHGPRSLHVLIAE